MKKYLRGFVSCLFMCGEHLSFRDDGVCCGVGRIINVKVGVSLW